jgi:cupin fold WbuC family metalloprotein
VGSSLETFFHLIAEEKFSMKIDKELLDKLTEQAKASQRLRMNYDLRNSAEDRSQRMLNALEPGTVMPVHRHLKSSETVVCIRGHFEEYFYDDNGVLTDTIDMVPGGVVLNVPIGMWHSLKSLESGTVLLECKDGRWEPLGEEEVMG